MLINTTKTDALSSAVGRPIENEYGYELRSKELISSSLQPYSSQILVGTVIEVNQQLNCYIVRVGNYPDIRATSLDFVGRSLVNRATSSCLFGVGAAVYVMMCGSTGNTLGVILGAAPEHFGAITVFGSQELIPASPAGSGLDKISNEALNSEQNNYNNGRPVDTYPGDVTILSAFGSGLFVGALQASLRASTECAVECHYVDSLLRLTSYNFEQFSAGADRQFIADCGDYTEIKRGNSYIIESVGGTTQYGIFPKKAGEDRGTAGKPSPDLGKYAPEVIDQVGWWRWLDLSGYLANIKLQFVLVPKLNTTRQGAAANTDQDEHAVFREHVDSTGAYSVVSAKSISFIKDCLIPAPKEQYRSDDSRGDKEESIASARQENTVNLKDVEIIGVATNDPDAAILYAAASSDLAAFRTHRSLVMFRERKTDWSLKEVDEIDLAGFRSVLDAQGLINPSTNVSESRMHALLPQIGKLTVTAKEEVSYFASRSMIMMNDDGSIHIQDGYGSSISMRAGCIDISCPGDITLRPGRNLVGFAGDSISAIAGVDVELCGMKGDIRIQADRNVSVLGGNDGKGGVLLESKAVFAPLITPDEETFKLPDTNSNAYRGIWFKAPNAGICSLASQAYIGNTSKDCKIALDCGKSDFTVKGELSYILSKQTYLITNPDAPKEGSYLGLRDSTGLELSTPHQIYFKSSKMLAAPITGNLLYYISGKLFVDSETVLRSLYVPKSGGGGSPVRPIDDGSFNENVVTPTKTAIGLLDESLEKAYTAHQTSYAKINSSLVGKAESSLRNLTFYYPDSTLRGIPESSKYVLFEADWQSAYRSNGQGAPLKIKGVKLAAAGREGISDDQSYCWPGLQALQKKFGKFKTSSRFVSPTLSFKKDGFDQPLELLDTPVSFDGSYTVIRTNSVRTKQ